MKKAKSDPNGKRTNIPVTDEQLREHGWQDVGNAPVNKWTDVGVSAKIIGRFMNLEPKHGDSSALLTIETDDNGLESWWCPTILEKRLAVFQPGDLVFIEYLGVITTGGGRQAHDFKVLRKPGAGSGVKQEALPV